MLIMTSVCVRLSANCNLYVSPPAVAVVSKGAGPATAAVAAFQLRTQRQQRVQSAGADSTMIF